MTQPLCSGRVTPPADLHGAARQELGEHYEKFIEEFGQNFTPKQLVQRVEELRYGSGLRHDAS